MGSEKSDNGIDREAHSSYFGRLSEEETPSETRRRIVGREDVRERKKWERPPLVGAPNNFHPSSDSELDTPTQSAYFSSRTEFIAGKPSSEPSLEADTRGRSPSSMSNSSVRPLEWDSSADVGCAPYPVSQKLSTLEKLALERGCSSLLTRSDPEGTTGNVRVAGAPTATSTPVTVRVEKSDDKSYYPLFPEVVVLHHPQESSSDKEKSPLPAAKVCGEKDDSKASKLGKKLSSSLENMREKSGGDFVPATFPRSFSQNNVNSEGIKLPHKSNSSSSVATVVTKKNSSGSSKYKPQGDFNTLESCGMSSEDRAHSFEYLPGHIYENTVHPNPEVEEKLWSSGDNTLRRDVDRGVSLLADFVRGSKMNDRALKKELLRRVVEKLIRSEYLEDEEKAGEDEEGKKSVPEEIRAEVSGESTGVSHSAQSFSSHQESDPASKNRIGTRPSTSLSGQSASSEWNSYSVESPSAEYVSSESKDSKETKIKPVRRPTRPRPFSVSMAKPTLQSEGKFQNLKAEGDLAEHQLIGFLNSERENQLLWIQREISHLTSLKKLLEKHEVLKKKLGNLKKPRGNNEKGKRRLLSEVEESNGRFIWRRQTLAETLQQNRNMESRDRHTSSSLTDTLKGNGWSSHHYYETDTERKFRKGKRDACTETVTSVGVQTSNLRKCPKSVAYSIIFDEKASPKEEVSRNIKSPRKGDQMVSLDELHSAINEILGRRERLIEGRSDPQRASTSFKPRPTLQDYLARNRPSYVQRAEERQKILSEIMEYREAREQQKTRILAASVHPDGAQDPNLPPHPLARRRITNQRNMRRLTERKYRKTAEVQNKKSEVKKKESFRTNRLMAEIFNKNLQKKTLRGEVNLSNSVSILAH